MRVAGRVLLVVLFAMAAPVQAQEPGCRPARAASAADTAKPDIVLNARVTARVLRFNADPQTSLTVSGCPAVDTSRVSIRTNLPTPVQANVVYQNVLVDFKLRLTIAELDCLLADAIARTTADSTMVRRARECSVNR